MLRSDTGKVVLVNTSLDTCGLLIVAAGDCRGRIGGETLGSFSDALETP